MIKRAEVLVTEEYAKRFAAILINRAAAGQDVIITRAGAPYAKIAALEQNHRRV